VSLINQQLVTFTFFDLESRRKNGHILSDISQILFII